MNSNERFGQIEAMLADLLRRMDRQSEQIDAIINILKISDERQTRAEERQTRAEERQDAMLAEMRRGFAESDCRFEEHNKRLTEHNKRFDAQQEAIKKQGERLDTMLNSQMQMLELMSRNATKSDELNQRIPSILEYDARVRRLEEAVFKKAS